MFTYFIQKITTDGWWVSLILAICALVYSMSDIGRPMPCWYKKPVSKLKKVLRKMLFWIILVFYYFSIILVIFIILLSFSSAFYILFISKDDWWQRLIQIFVMAIDVLAIITLKSQLSF